MNLHNRLYRNHNKLVERAAAALFHLGIDALLLTCDELRPFVSILSG
jgi:hypothetical protein